MKDKYIYIYIYYIYIYIYIYNMYTYIYTVCIYIYICTHCILGPGPNYSIGWEVMLESMGRVQPKTSKNPCRTHQDPVKALPPHPPKLKQPEPQYKFNTLYYNSKTSPSTLNPPKLPGYIASTPKEFAAPTPVTTPSPAPAAGPSGL